MLKASGLQPNPSQRTFQSEGLSFGALTDRSIAWGLKQARKPPAGCRQGHAGQLSIIPNQASAQAPPALWWVCDLFFFSITEASSKHTEVNDVTVVSQL